MVRSVDANTLGSIACIASIDWGCAVQVMAAASIGSGGAYVATTGNLFPLKVNRIRLINEVCRTNFRCIPPDTSYTRDSVFSGYGDPS